MGRWTPLILMAGGVAILLGTLLGINFPMGGQQNANVPSGRKSSVLPANINVNSTASRREPESTSNFNNEPETSAGNEISEETPRRVAQSNSNTESPSTENTPSSTTEEGAVTESPSSSTDSSSGNTQEKQPIRALW